MSPARIWPVWTLGVVAVLSAACAAAIFFVSAAHGHGLAAGDARAVALLGVIAAVSAVGAAMLALRRRRQ